MSTHKDFAIILAWPDATIRGDEKWMMFFKKIGIVKNLNFKVGHTGIIIVNSTTGEILFYDFGRYITPRGYGRARSKNSDPLLNINLKAKIKNNEIANIDKIIDICEKMKPFMYGEGKLFFSIVKGIDFQLAQQYGDACVEEGTYPYGALAKNNNNCSRFITRMLRISHPRYSWHHCINLPETIKSSPVSNLVNAVEDRMIFSFCTQEGIKKFKMNRFQSLWFLIKQLGENVKRKKAELLPDDKIIGAMNYNSKPITVPKDAVYLGGVGDGAWYSVNAHDSDHYIIKRFTSHGILEYVVIGKPEKQFDINQKWTITYDSHLLFTHIIQNNEKIKIIHSKQLPNDKYAFEDIKERYA